MLSLSLSHCVYICVCVCVCVCTGEIPAAVVRSDPNRGAATPSGALEESDPALPEPPVCGRYEIL